MVGALLFVESKCTGDRRLVFLVGRLQCLCIHLKSTIMNNEWVIKILRKTLLNIYCNYCTKWLSARHTYRISRGGNILIIKHLGKTFQILLYSLRRKNFYLMLGYSYTFVNMCYKCERIDTNLRLSK